MQKESSAPSSPPRTTTASNSNPTVQGTSRSETHYNPNTSIPIHSTNQTSESSMTMATAVATNQIQQVQMNQNTNIPPQESGALPQGLSGLASNMSGAISTSTSTNNTNSSSSTPTPSSSLSVEEEKRMKRVLANRRSARKSRERRRQLEEDLQRSVVILSRENEELKSENEILKGQVAALMRICAQPSNSSSMNGLSRVNASATNPALNMANGLGAPGVGGMSNAPLGHTNGSPPLQEAHPNLSNLPPPPSTLAAAVGSLPTTDISPLLLATASAANANGQAGGQAQASIAALLEAQLANQANSAPHPSLPVSGSGSVGVGASARPSGGSPSHPPSPPNSNGNSINGTNTNDLSTSMHSIPHGGSAGAGAGVGGLPAGLAMNGVPAPSPFPPQNASDQAKLMELLRLRHLVNMRNGGPA